MKTPIPSNQFTNSWYNKLFVEIPDYSTRMTLTGTMPLTELWVRMWRPLASFNSYGVFNDTHMEVCGGLEALQKYVGSAKYVEAGQDKDLDQKIVLQRKESVLALGATSVSASSYLTSSSSSVTESKTKSQTFNQTTPLVAYWQKETNERLTKELTILLTIYGGARCVIEQNNQFLTKIGSPFIQLVEKIGAHNNVANNTYLIEEMNRIDTETKKLREVLIKLKQDERMLEQAEKRFGLTIEASTEIKEIKLEECEKYIKEELEAILQKELRNSSIEKGDLNTHLGKIRFYIKGLKEKIDAIHKQSNLLSLYSKSFEEVRNALTQLKIVISSEQVTQLEFLLEQSQEIFRKIHEDWSAVRYDMPLVLTDKSNQELLAPKIPSIEAKTKGRTSLSESNIFELGYRKEIKNRVELYKEINNFLTEMLIMIRMIGSAFSSSETNVGIKVQKMGFYANELYKLTLGYYRKLHLPIDEKGTQSKAKELWGIARSSLKSTDCESLVTFIDQESKIESLFDRESLPYFFQFQLKSLILLSERVKDFQNKATEMNLQPDETVYFKPFSQLNFEKYELCLWTREIKKPTSGKLYIKMGTKSSEIAFLIQTKEGPAEGVITQKEFKNYFPETFTIENFQPYLSKIVRIIKEIRKLPIIKQGIRGGEDENIKEMKAERADLLSRVAETKHPLTKLCIEFRSQYMIAVYKQVQLLWMLNRDPKASSSSESDYKLAFNSFKSHFEGNFAELATVRHLAHDLHIKIANQEYEVCTLAGVTSYVPGKIYIGKKAYSADLEFVVVTDGKKTIKSSITKAELKQEIPETLTVENLKLLLPRILEIATAKKFIKTSEETENLMKFLRTIQKECEDLDYQLQNNSTGTFSDEISRKFYYGLQDTWKNLNDPKSDKFCLAQSSTEEKTRIQESPLKESKYEGTDESSLVSLNSSVRISFAPAKHSPSDVKIETRETPDSEGSEIDQLNSASIGQLSITASIASKNISQNIFSPTSETSFLSSQGVGSFVETTNEAKNTPTGAPDASLDAMVGFPIDAPPEAPPMDSPATGGAPAAPPMSSPIVKGKTSETKEEEKKPLPTEKPPRDDLLTSIRKAGGTSNFFKNKKEKAVSETQAPKSPSSVSGRKVSDEKNNLQGNPLDQITSMRSNLEQDGTDLTLDDPNYDPTDDHSNSGEPTKRHDWDGEEDDEDQSGAAKEKLNVGVLSGSSSLLGSRTPPPPPAGRGVGRGVLPSLVPGRGNPPGLGQGRK